jgi:hypothetical protein
MNTSKQYLDHFKKINNDNQYYIDQSGNLCMKRVVSTPVSLPVLPHLQRKDNEHVINCNFFWPKEIIHNINKLGEITESRYVFEGRLRNSSIMLAMEVFKLDLVKPIWIKK